MNRVGTKAAMLVAVLLAVTSIAAGRTGHGAALAGALPGAGTGWVDFSLPDLSGREVSMARFIGKKPVLLAFWATWCPHCNGSVTTINRMYKEPAGSSGGLQILALNFMESREKVSAFVSSKKVLYPILLDRNGDVARSYKVVGIPTYVLIDRNGRLVYRDHDLPDVNRLLR
jgi:peroxiredoxin